MTYEKKFRDNLRRLVDLLASTGLYGRKPSSIGKALLLDPAAFRMLDPDGSPSGGFPTFGVHVYDRLVAVMFDVWPHTVVAWPDDIEPVELDEVRPAGTRRRAKASDVAA